MASFDEREDLLARLWNGLRFRYRTDSKFYWLRTCFNMPTGTHSIDQALTLFGRPKLVTGFFRVQRGIESEVEDSFTIVLEYDGEQIDLLVTVKTSVTTPMQHQFKFLVRGTKGAYLKVLAPLFTARMLI